MMMGEVYVPERFVRVISLHVAKNLMRNALDTPLILGIHGPSGDGKTFQCERTLHELGVRAFLISGGQLESERAGSPARLIRDRYLDASEHIAKERKAAALLLNDIDTGIGNWGDNVQYTVNRQTVLGELMHLVDYPTVVNSLTVKRVPIIVTGNDFTKLYEPLVRAGRMSLFTWEPTFEEKLAIVCRIFAELTPALSTKVVETLEKKQKHRLPISFYSHLNSTLHDEAIWTEMRRVGVTAAISLLSKGTSLRPRLELDADFVLRAANDLIETGTLVNHLARVKR